MQVDDNKNNALQFQLGEVEQTTVLQTEKQIVVCVKVAQGKFFSAQQSQSREETVTIVKGEGRYEMDGESKTIAPISLIKLTADKVCKIFNDRLETLVLYFVSIPSENLSNEQYVRLKQNCFEIKTGNSECIYELFGIYGNGPAQSHSMAVVDIAEKGYSQEHYHPKVEESYVVIQGNAKLDVDGKSTELNVGDAALIPVGKKHQIWNIGCEVLSFLAVVTPPWNDKCGIYTPLK